MISRSSEGGGSLPIVDYIGFMPIDLGAVNFDALPLPDMSFEVRVPLCLPPFKPGQALAKGRSATSAVVLLTDRPECLAPAIAGR